MRKPSRRRPQNQRAAALLLSLVLLLAEPQVPLLAEESPKLSTQENSSPVVSMSFDGALLKDVLVLLSQQSGFNFVSSQDVEAKKVTVYLDNVSVRDALDAIVSANNLSYVQRPGNIILVTQPTKEGEKTEELQTKIFRLKYAHLSTSPLQTAGQSTIGDLMAVASASTSSSSSSGGASSNSSIASDDRGIDKIIGKMISSKGKVTMDIRTNSLIVTDTAEKLKQIEKVVSQIDIPSRQVVLEVYIMEVQKALVSDMGVEWGGTDGALASFQAGARTTSFPFSEKALNSRILDKTKVVAPIAASEDLTFDGTDDAFGPAQMTLGLFDARSLAATLHAVMEDSKTKILARPRILTQNNEAAEIKVVTNQTVGLTSNTTSAGGVNQQNTNVADRKDVGIQLKMTPQINEDDSVALFLEPSVSTVNTSTFSTDFLDPRTRVVRTVARVKNNQTLVIGGLIEGNYSNTNRKIPFLGDIPIIGNAFSYQANDDSDRELLVFITPHIVKGTDSFWQSDVTSIGRDLAAQRMLNEFSAAENERTRRTFEAIDQIQKDAEYSKTPKVPFPKTKSKSSNPSLDKLMTQALDAQTKKPR